MKLMHTMGAALIALASDDASAGGVGSLRRSITIANEAFEVAVPYAEGHQLNAAEASVLNQTYAENVRNNVAGKIKAAKEAYVKEHGSDDGFSLDTITVPGENEGETVTLRQSLTAYADAYEFGLRVARTAEPVDPVQREARVIARDMVNSALKAGGNKRKDVSDEAYEQAVSALAQRDDVQKEAKRRVDQKSKIGGGELDLSALLGGAGEPASEGSEA